MSLFKEIVTKAVVGKGKKTFKNTYTMEATNIPNTILGCWVINHTFKGYKTNNMIEVSGSYDVNIWYSYDNDSKTMVATKKIEYKDPFNINLNANSALAGGDEIIVKSLKQPSCSDVKFEGNKISFDIEKELGIEIVGDTKVKISVEEDEEPFEEILEEVKDEVIEEIDSKVNEEYMK